MHGFIFLYWQLCVQFTINIILVGQPAELLLLERCFLFYEFAILLVVMHLLVGSVLWRQTEEKEKKGYFPCVRVFNFVLFCFVRLFVWILTDSPFPRK